MKSTIKLSTFESVVIDSDGIHVSLSIVVGSVPVTKKLLTLDTCGALLAAVEGAAAEAEKYRAALVANAAYAAQERKRGGPWQAASA